MHQHDSWACAAAGDWNTVAGENCKLLGDLAHKALDAASAGNVVDIPPRLHDVHSNSLARRTCLQRPHIYTASVGPLCESVDASTLRDAISTYGLMSVSEVWVNRQRGFVGFASEAEREQMVGKQLQLNGQKCTVARDTRGKEVQRGILDRLWEAYAEFVRVSLTDPEDSLNVMPDSELEDQNDADILNLVRTEFADTLEAMARAYREPNTHELISQMKHDIKVRLTRRLGIQRDLYASGWFTLMRERLNEDLGRWARSDSGKAAGAPRPLPKLWINEIFGKDWERLKSTRLPPQISYRNAATLHPVAETWAPQWDEHQPLRPTQEFIRIA